MRILSITPEMRELAHHYVAEKCFSPAMLDDALHIAVAVIGKQDILISWNFRHLVNRTRRARVNAVNANRGYPSLEILAPPEL